MENRTMKEGKKEESKGHKKDRLVRHKNSSVLIAVDSKHV